jgi:hypothetical protein
MTCSPGSDNFCHTYTGIYIQVTCTSGVVFTPKIVILVLAVTAVAPPAVAIMNTGKKF